MPKAIALALRREIVRQRQQGHKLTEIAQCLGLKYKSVRECFRRYRLQGEAGLQIHYSRCGRSGPRYPARIREVALSLKGEHPRWGAGLILLEMAQQAEIAGQLPEQRLPHCRTLQRWFRAAGLQMARAKQPKVPKSRARKAHEVWEVDAKEKMWLKDGSGTSVLTVTDEGTGALLEVAPFPPLSLGAGAGPERAG